MAAPTTIEEAILQTAVQAKRVRRDDMEVEQHSLKDLIAAAEYLDSGGAASQPHFGLRMTKLVPPGTG